jgi:xanthine dehydrogenase accessory factor
LNELLQLLCDCLEKDRPIALASIIDSQGSTPRGAGARLIADKDGLVAGTVGGGLLEGRTLEACRACLLEDTARILDFTLTGDLAAESDMICGGRLRVLIEPLLPPAEHRRFFQAVREAWIKDGAVLITDFTEAARPRRTAIIGPRHLGEPLPESMELLAAWPPNQETATISRGRRSYFLERFLAPRRLIIAGGGHVSRATAQAAALAGFEVSVLDDRPEFSQPERFPWAARVATIADYRDCFAEGAPEARTSIVIATRGHLYDAAVLSQAVATKAGYIGLIGSRRKREQIYAALRAQGVGEEALARVHCPIGLDIGAVTPEEIAVSIVAECIRQGRKAGPLEP